MKTLVSVVVPFYNEEDNVAPLAAKISEVFAGMPDYDYECVFVNDGSSDGTRRELDRLKAENEHVRPLHLVKNRGQSAAVIAGMRSARGEYVMMLDGDLQNDPCDFPKMLELLKTADCVCGYRAKRNDTWVRKMSSKIGNGARQFILNDGIRDAGCGSKGFRKECIQYLVPFNGAHRYFAVIMRAAGKTIAECEVTHHQRIHGKSKYGIHNRLWRGIYDLFGVRWLKKRYVTYQIEQ